MIITWKRNIFDFVVLCTRLARHHKSVVVVPSSKFNPVENCSELSQSDSSNVVVVIVDGCCTPPCNDNIYTFFVALVVQHGLN